MCGTRRRSSGWMTVLPAARGRVPRLPDDVARVAGLHARALARASSCPGRPLQHAHLRTGSGTPRMAGIAVLLRMSLLATTPHASGAHAAMRYEMYIRGGQP